MPNATLRYAYACALLLTAAACSKQGQPSASSAPAPTATTGPVAPMTAQPTSATTAIPGAALPKTGYFELSFDPGSGWHQHALDISEAGAQLRGIAILDRGIGPIARAPNPDESSHIVAFVPQVSADDHQLSFAVVTGTIDPLRYQFELAFCPGAGKARCPGSAAIQGTVLIGDAEPAKVTGTRTDRSKAPTGMPPWEQIPRGDKRDDSDGPPPR